MNQQKTWVRITDCRNIPLREGRAVQVAGRSVAIFNLGGRFLAVENRCPHKDGPLSEGILSGTTVVCPLHAWKVSLESGDVANANGGGRCVETFRTRIEAGVVLLELLVEDKKDAQDAAPGICIKGSRTLSSPGSSILAAR